MGRASVAGETPGLLADFRSRYLDVVGSIYIYNEHRGYTSLDRVLEAARRHCPEDTGFLKAVAKHRADERKHYLMFKRWFELRGRMPLSMDTRFGHIDHFIRRAFGTEIDELDTNAILADPALFEQLCRVIVLTEQRGLAQLDILLRNRSVRSDAVLTRIFRIIHADEPDHFLPYRDWLERRARPVETRRERLIDWSIHASLLLHRLPALFLDAAAPRMAQWPDAGDAD